MLVWLLLPLLLGASSFAAGGSEGGGPGPAHRNRLAGETSPYLLLHAENPVDWYPWGPEALDRAAREGKPIFLSIGYSSCYWCHVMEREVFSDPEIAELMNRWFVNIKVDREERPELDAIYMTATQVLTGRGGWPNSVFLTPSLEPFYAGTYFPPVDRSGLPGFPTVLGRVHDAWETRRPDVLSGARRVADAVRAAMAPGPQGEDAPDLGASALEAVEALTARFDSRHGGFGGAPKFPMPSNLLLLRDRAEHGDAAARRMLLQTLRSMGRGGIYDHVGGGFHRYSVDAAWNVPHFEKMLYDNALLAEIYVRVGAAEKDAELLAYGRGTLDFLLREMRLEDGPFATAIDAETAGAEGAFYTWDRTELRTALGPADDAFLAPLLGFDGEPQTEDGRFVLRLTAAPADLASSRGLAPDVLESRLRTGLRKLRSTRDQRRRPRTDDKVLTGWNGMAVAALATAGRELGEPRYATAARRAASFLLEHLRTADGTLAHTWRGGRASIPAFAEDYAQLLRALLALHRLDAGARWLSEAERLSDELERRLRDPAGGYFQTTARPGLLVQPKTATDSAVPSANGVLALVLLDLERETGRSVYGARARATLDAFATHLARFPTAHATLARAALSVTP